MVCSSPLSKVYPEFSKAIQYGDINGDGYMDAIFSFTEVCGFGCGTGSGGKGEIILTKKSPDGRLERVLRGLASFYCFEAKKKTEKAICKNEKLGKLDIELSAVYSKKLSKTKDKEQLKRSQLGWLKKRNKKCKSIALIDNCLVEEYKNRINQLTK